MANQIATQPAAAQPQDLEALAKQYGGSVVTPTVTQPAGQSTGNAVDDLDALAKQYGGEAVPDQSNVTVVPQQGPTQSQSAVSKVSDVAEDVATGFGKGAVQTSNSVSSLLSKIPFVGQYLAPSVGIAAARKIAQPSNTAQGVGVGIEGLAEYMLTAEVGGEAVEAMSAGEKFKALSGIASFLEKNPRLARFVGHTVLSSAQSAAHAEPGQVGEAAGTGALYGLGGTATGELASAGLSKVIPMTKQGLLKQAEQDLAEHLSTSRKAAQTVQEAAAQASDAARGIPSYASPNASTAETFKDAANEIKDHFNPVFDALREQSGGVLNHDTGRFGPNGFDDAVNQIQRAKKIIYSPMPASTDALKQAETEFAAGNQKLNDLFGQNQDYAAAKAAWAKAGTLEDLHSLIDKSFTEPASVRDTGVTRGSLGEINPKKFVARANKAIDDIGSDNLSAALGPDAYKDLLTVRTELDNMLSDEAYGKSRDRLVREYARTLPKGSPLRTASYGLLSVLAGAGIGATAGAANASLTGEDVTTKTIEGAAKGGILGAAASVPITAGHWLYTHPNQTAKVLRLVKGMSQPAAQAIKQVKQSGQSGVVTHLFNAETGQAEPVNQ